MSDVLDFDGDAIESLNRLYRTDSMEERRAFVRRKLSPDPGESVLSVGTGPGFESRGLARSVGEDGHVLGIDASPSMLAVARDRCSDLPQAAFQAGEATALPVDDGAFECATAVQVFEYVEDVGAAAAELHRALAPGGRAVVFDSDCDTMVYGVEDPERSRRVLRAFDAHCTHPRIARTLRPTLEGAGFDVVDVAPYTHCETSPEGAGGQMADMIGEFVRARDGPGRDEVDAWLTDLEARADAGEFFFSFSQYAFVVEKPRE